MKSNTNRFCLIIFFLISWGCYGGAMAPLGGAEAPASPSLAPPMPGGGGCRTRVRHRKGCWLLDVLVVRRSRGWVAPFGRSRWFSLNVGHDPQLSRRYQQDRWSFCVKAFLFKATRSETCQQIQVRGECLQVRLPQRPSHYTALPPTTPTGCSIGAG